MSEYIYHKRGAGYKSIFDLLRYAQPDPKTGCILWARGLQSMGYGQVRFNGKTMKAHRVAYILANGPIGDNDCVLHQCDTPACINPDHLHIGTKGDNNRERELRGRHPHTRGEKAPQAKLSDADLEKIRELRSKGMKYREIAAIFNITAAYAQVIACKYKKSRRFSH